jgi:predicted nuclease of predicted toxin-antitoxin system
VLVRTGNIRTDDLKELFQRQLPAIVQALANNSLVELDRVAVHVVV